MNSCSFRSSHVTRTLLLCVTWFWSHGQQRHMRQCTGTESATDSLIPPGRRHNNAQLPGLHLLSMPADNELHTLIATHISGINKISSPGGDTITPTFIECAYKHVPKKTRERLGEYQCAGSSHCCSLQTAHCKSQHPQVSERSKAHSHSQ